MPDSEIVDAVVSFANTDGGDLYLGIEDSGEVTGINSKHKNITAVAAFIANNTVPPLPVRAEIIDDILPVLKISVPKSSGGIVATSSGKIQHRRLKADGTPENVPMYPNEFATRLSDLRLLDYSAMPLLDATLEDFDPLEVAHLRSVILSYAGDKSLLGLSDEEMFKALGFVREINGQLIPLVTGILIAGRVSALSKYIPTHSASFQVLSGTSVKVNEDIRLPLLSAIDKINTYMDAWNSEKELEMDLFRVSVPDFDKRAFREGLVNAFSHRDYSKMGRVRVQVSDEGLTIANPGGFIEGVSINNLLTAEPRGRNPHLSDVLKRLGLAEKTGRGIDRIYEASLIYGSPLPDYGYSTSVTVSLFIPRSKPDPQIAMMIAKEQKRLGHALSLNTLLVLNGLKDRERVRISSLAGEIKLSEREAKYILDSSAENGLVDIYERGTVYGLSSKVYRRERNKPDQTACRMLILSEAKKRDFITRADAARLLNVDCNKAYRLLSSLAESGQLLLVGKGRYAKYRYSATE